jgi:NAD(P)H dehydrogenase (quinone)
MTIVVTGATGHLGRLTIESLLAKGVPASSIVGIGRQVDKIADLGVTALHVSYDDPAALRSAFEGADKLLFISSSAVGPQRVEQHTNVIEAAKAAGVGQIVYTSAPKADTTDMKLAADHAYTEKLIKDSGLPYVILRNGWYVENYPVDQAIAQGLVGASGDGRISLAPRADYAEATAAVLATDGHVGTTYELGGEAVTKTELADEISRQSGQPVTYTNLDLEKYRDLLLSFGLPSEAAEVYADIDRAAAAGALLVAPEDLEKLLGRPATPVATSITNALAAS